LSLFTTALIALGIVSQASASSTATIGSTTYTVVYITGSTAFRANVFTAVENNVFDSNSYTTQPASGLSGSSSKYNIYGNIGGVPYLLSFDFTGSEAGLAALQDVAVSNPNTAPTLSGYSSGTVNLPGTPLPTAFVNPLGGAAVTAQPDLAFADTSRAVSLTAANVVLKDYGIVAVIPFTWAKGVFTTPDSSWNDLVNITDPQANLLLSTEQTASFFTGNVNDQDDVYLIGRNKGSGTRVNTMLDTLHGVNNGVVQYVPGNTTYSGGALTVGTVESLATAGLVEVDNDGFDSGGGVANTLLFPVDGALDQYSSQIITVGYLGFADFNGTDYGHGVIPLTLNGVEESDGAIQNGTYSFWGHEHLYGTVGQASTSPGGKIAQLLAGTTVNESLGTAFHSTGALESSFGLTGGGRELNPLAATAVSGTASAALDAATVHADKAGDAGYASQQN